MIFAKKDMKKKNKVIKSLICSDEYKKERLIDNSPKREKIKICIIDDEGYHSLDKLMSLGYKNVDVKYQFSNIEEYKDYDVIFCDIQGIGNVHYPTNKGFDVALELKNKYPLCNVFIYTGLDLSQMPKLPDSIEYVSKNTSVKEMVALLDKECEYLWNPIKAWEKIENSLRKSQIPNKYIAFFEDRFFRSVIDNESNINDASFDQLNSFENFKYCVTIVASLIDVILRFQGR